MFRIKQPGTFTIPMLILVLVLTLMLPGSESVAALPSTVSSNKALIQHYYDLFNSRSWDSLTDVLPPDVVDHDPAPHEGSGSDGIKQTLMAITSAFPDMTITVDDLVVEGSKVADRVQVKGTHKGTFFGLAATNKAVSFETMTLWHISNNKVTEMWHSDGGIVNQLTLLLSQSTTGAQSSTPTAGVIVAVPPTQAPHSSSGLPALSFKHTPKEITFQGCPPEGDGGDPILNKNKNRVDDGNYQPVAFNTILKLPWPQETERKAHSEWSQSAQDEVAKAEGLPVLVEGFLALARQEGPETPNCHSSTDFDFHIWMIDHAGGSADRINAVVIEATPRVRAKHPRWTVSRLSAIATAGTPVRISGWIMLDPEHPDQVGKTRGTIWEIHPVMQIEVQTSGKWVKLDDYHP